MEEEKKTQVEGNETASKPTYEQLFQINQVLQQRYMQLETRVQQLDNIFTRLNYLFNVLDRSQYFAPEFVEACATEIQDILDTRNTDTEE